MEVHRFSETFENITLHSVGNSGYVSWYGDLVTGCASEEFGSMTGRATDASRLQKSTPTHSHLVPGLRISGAVPLISHRNSCCAQGLCEERTDFLNKTLINFRIQVI